MKLGELLAGVHPTHVTGRTDVEAAEMTHDSRRVKPGSVFFALPGAKTDGNRHAKEAARLGAAAIVSALGPPPAPIQLAATWVQVPDIVSAMGTMADRFYGHPSGSLAVIGVTGTNGKTTTSYFLESIIAASGGRPAVAGTINYRLDGRVLESAVNTTPISLHIQSLLAEFRNGGATHVAMEVSSHALALRRVDEIDFDAAIFTNLRRDHLDFHKTREEYLAAKTRLIDLLCRASSAKKRRVAVVNEDDPCAENFKRRVIDAEIIRFGLKAGDLRADGLDMSLEGTSFGIVSGKRRLKARIRLIGEHNVYNALGAAAAALGLGMDEKSVLRGLADLASVPGRLEAVRAGQDFHVFVDYAHTDSALETVLSYLGRLPHRKLITVFGCGGDRDRTKRGPMGVAACRASTLAIVTSDNPRGEDPQAIIADIVNGLKREGRKNYRIEPDRRLAIEQALNLARKGDIVLIAGKGHEDYQILKDKTIHFDDREEALKTLRKKTEDAE